MYQIIVALLGVISVQMVTVGVLAFLYLEQLQPIEPEWPEWGDHSDEIPLVANATLLQDVILEKSTQVLIVGNDSNAELEMLGGLFPNLTPSELVSLVEGL